MEIITKFQLYSSLQEEANSVSITVVYVKDAQYNKMIIKKPMYISVVCVRNAYDKIIIQK